jgi:hypothetical protein
MLEVIAERLMVYMQLITKKNRHQPVEALIDR